jgi:hypothetical protein
MMMAKEKVRRIKGTGREEMEDVTKEGETNEVEERNKDAKEEDKGSN